MSAFDAPQSENRPGVEYSGPIGWWRALGITFVWSAHIKELFPPLAPPDNYGPFKCFFVVMPQKYSPFTGKQNGLFYIVHALLFLPMLVALYAVTYSVGVLHGLVVLVAFCFVYVALLAVSLVAYFRAGGWVDILEERDKRKNLRYGGRMNKVRDVQDL